MSTVDRASSIFAALRAMKLDMVRLRDERAVYDVACRELVALAGVRFAWIGVLAPEDARIVPVASAGDGVGYLDDVRISYADTERGAGPTGKAAREGAARFCPDIETDPAMAPWRDAALARGFRSSCAVPIRRAGRVHAVLNLYRAGKGFGDPLEQNVIEGIAEEIGLTLDVVEEAEQRKASEERYRTLFEAATDGIFLTDGELRYTDVNPAGCAMLGYTRDELVGRKLTELIDPTDLARMPSTPARYEEGVPFVVERRLVRKDGSLVEVEIHGVKLSGGRLQSVTRDIGARKRAAAERAAQERVVALGRVAQGVAHEVNNPLSYLVLALHALEERLPAVPEEHREHLAEPLADALDGARRVAHIVKSLSTFGRADVETIGPVDFARVVAAAQSLTRNRLAHVARLVVEGDPIPPVRANEFGLTQVLVNLLLNAADALEGHRSPAAPSHVVRVCSRIEGTVAVIEVEDDGPGLAPEVRARLFEPFLTTKPPGRGTGLGLSLSRAMVTRFGGSLEGENRPGGGACFRIRLPFAEVAAPSQLAKARAARTPKLRVVVVDDEPLMRKSLALLLAPNVALPFEDVPSALEACLREPPDLVVCDLMLRDQPGSVLYEALAAANPSLARRIVFVTGGAFTPALEDFLATTKNVVLAKPFAMDELQEAVAKALAR